MRFHPYAEVFPLLSDEELKDLASDIKSFGLREPIWLYDGQILDGRNRWLACQRAKVEPQYRTFKGTDKGALALVVSANMNRRQLTFEQRALAAARIAEFEQGRPEKTGTGAGLTQAEAAKKFDVSERSVRSARKVIEQGSKPLQKAVESGEVSLKKAAAVATLPKREQLAAAKNTAAKEPDPTAEAPEKPQDVDEDAALAAAEAEMGRTFDRLLGGDSDAKREIERLTKLVGTLESSRDGYMRGKEEMMKLLKAEQRKTARLEKRVAELEAENARLRKRAA